MGLQVMCMSRPVLGRGCWPDFLLLLLSSKTEFRPDKHMDNRDLDFGVLLLLLGDKLHALLATSGPSSKSIQHEKTHLEMLPASS